MGTELRVPVNHFEGNYTCDEATAAALAAEGRVVLRYVDNPNGSVGDIAGVCNETGNVVGLMPHPERACDPLLGSDDGNVLLGALLTSVAAPAGVGLSRRPARRRRPCSAGGPSRYRRRNSAVRALRSPAQLRARGILACWRTEALTPTVRHAEYEMPLRSP